MSTTSGLLSLPVPVLSRICTFAVGFDTVEIEVDEQGILLTRACRLLRICKQLRQDVLNTCHSGHLRLVHTVTSPVALASLLSQTPSRASLEVRNLRCVLLAEFEDVPSTEVDEFWYGTHPKIAPLFNAWREAFKSIPRDTAITLVYFDLVRSFNLHTDVFGRLINCLSAILRQRSSSRARCRILGCFTTHGQKFFENSAVNVVESKIDLRGKRPDRGREKHPEEYSKRQKLSDQAEDQSTQQGMHL